MESNHRSKWIYGLLLAIWALVVIWQINEHARVREGGRNYLRRNSKAIANTIGAVVRGLQFRGAVFRDRLQPILDELVASDTNSVSSGEVISIEMLNATNGVVASAGRPVDFEQADILQAGEHWGPHSMTRVYPVEGAFLTNTLILEPPTNAMRGPRNFGRRRPPSDDKESSSLLNAATNAAGTNASSPGQSEPPPPPPGNRNRPGFNPPPQGERRGPPPEGEPESVRPFWARGMDDQQYEQLVATHELHGLVLTLSTQPLQAVINHDLWLRFIIAFFAGVSAAGAGLALRNISKTAELQIRLVRASELNTHLREMNLAAAGLAHETRNPLNIIRGMAQMLSKKNDASPEVREKSRAIVDEVDKVTAQLNEFINYSRPREVRRARILLNAAVNEVARALNYDLDEKKIQLDIKVEPLTIEADEQLLRQALFNLVLNATQAVDAGGHIQINAARNGNSEAQLEVRDDGPGVPPERREEIFKPYFTTHQQGTGLGLAVVQQIVLAHGWEIHCLANEPRGARFRITHLKVAA